ncbi:MAG TPA: ATP-binding protein, partial [Minicystis sp.]|nr:ATP-binding protein [Minicystis sp.]
LDRRVAEQLFDPLLQLARNAVAHGVESAAERAMRGKPRVGVIELAAERRASGLRLVVRDDGAGVDVADVRARAVAKGMISTATARAADDATLLALLFVPGFTTRDSADLRAGRGVGLDLALEAVHRLGGTIRLASEPGMGLTATLEIPFEPGLVRVVWIDAGGATYALPVPQVRRVLLARDVPDARALAALLEPSIDAGPPPALAVEVAPHADARALAIAVDAVGAVEEVALRGLSPLVRTAGPYAGVVVRSDELRLCLDAAALGDLALSRPARAS